MARDTPAEREVTTDRKRIEQWAEDHDVVPVRRERGGEEIVDLVPEPETHRHHDEISWDEFYDEIDRSDMAVVYHEKESRPFEVMHQQELLGQPHVESEDVEQALLSGETVTATLTETTVIEQTIVEEVTLESEIVDRTTVQESFVDGELTTRDVDHCTVTEVQGAETITDESMLETGHESDDSIHVEVGVDEEWTVTTELLDRLTIETRVVDTQATETDTVESDTFEETIDIEGVQEQILKGDLLAAEEKATDVIESGTIESQFREGDVIETSLLERKTVEDEFSVRKEFSDELRGARTVAADTIGRETVASEVAADENLDVAEMGAVTEEETVVESDAEGGMERTGDHPVPTDEEEGKTVVDASGEEVGMVVGVEGDTMYVDPHPSLTDRIKQVLGWGERDDETYPLRADHVEQITDDKIQLAGEEDLER